MGFRAGAQKIFGETFEPESVTLEHAIGVGEAMADIETAKAKNTIAQAKLLDTTISRMDTLFRNSKKFSPKMKAAIADPIVSLAKTAFGVNWNRDHVINILGDENAMTDMGNMMQDLIDKQGTAGEQAATEALSRSGMSQEDFMNAIKFSEQNRAKTERAAILSRSAAGRDKARDIRLERQQQQQILTLQGFKDKQIEKFRKPIDAATKGNISKIDNFTQLDEIVDAVLADDPTGFDDAVLIDVFNRMSNSLGVRENDVRRALAVGSIAQRMERSFKSLFTDKQFLPEQREDLLKTMLGFARAAKKKIMLAQKIAQQQAKAGTNQLQRQIPPELHPFVSPEITEENILGPVTASNLELMNQIENKLGHLSDDPAGLDAGAPVAPPKPGEVPTRKQRIQQQQQQQQQLQPVQPRKSVTRPTFTTKSNQLPKDPETNLLIADKPRNDYYLSVMQAMGTASERLTFLEEVMKHFIVDQRVIDFAEGRKPQSNASQGNRRYAPKETLQGEPSFSPTGGAK